MLTNRDVREAVQSFSQGARSAESSTSQTPQKRPLEREDGDQADEQPQKQRTNALDQAANNRKLKMAFYGREDDVFDSKDKLGPDMHKCMHHLFSQ